MLHKVYLYGDLGEKYGKEFRFDISSVPQAVSALVCNFKDFLQDFKDGFYRVIVSNNKIKVELDEETLNFSLGQDKEIHIIPIPAGSKNQGTMKIIAGLALLIPFGGLFAASMLAGTTFASVAAAGAAATTAFTVAGVSVSVGALASVGLSLLIGGISQALTKAPKIEQATTYDKNASFIFSGAINKTQQGTPVPIVYGRFRTGSVVVSSGMQIEQLL